MNPTPTLASPLTPEAVDSLLASAAVNAAPGRGAKLAPGLNAQLATVATLARTLPLDGESPGFLIAINKHGSTR